MLLRAFAEARQAVPGLTLDIAGRGPLEPALRALARELGVDDAVRFLGHVSPIQGAIERAAVVVVPSMGEGFGMVALEAMERARPVIAAAIGGLGELVGDGETGLLVAPGEAEPLAAAIVALAGDLERAARMGEAGRRRALADFLEERCTERTERALPRGARGPLVDLDASARPSAVDTRTPDRRRGARPERRRSARSPGAAPGRARRPRPFSASCARVVGRHERGRSSPSDDELRRGAASSRDDGLRRQHRLEQREAEALPARRVDDTSHAAVERRDVADPAGQEHAVGDAELARERLERGRSGPSPSTTSIASGKLAAARGRPTSTPFCGSSRATQRRTRAPSGTRAAGSSRPRLGQRVEPVVDDLDLLRRQPDALDVEAAHAPR